MSRTETAGLNNILGLESEAVSPEIQLVSVNQLKAWEKCKTKYRLDYVDGLFWPSDQRNFEFGQDVHKLMDYHAKGFNCDSVLTQASLKVKNAYQLLLQAEITNKPVVASEWGFQVPVEGFENYWLAGRVDRVSRDGDNIIIVDWKTGTAIPKNPKEAWQTQLYLYCFYGSRQAFGLNDLQPEQLAFWYVEVKDQVRLVKIPYSQVFHAAVKQRITDTLAIIQQETAFALPSRCPDHYCPYQKICGIQQQEDS